MSLPPWWTVVFPLSGILIGIYLYRRGRRDKLPRYVVQSVALLGSSGALPGDIQILCRGQPVQKVTRTDVILWNAGRLSILKGDVIEPIQLHLPDDVQILKSQIIRNTADSTGFETSDIALNRTQINFEHIGHEDGARIQILHTGDASSTVTVKGRIADAPRTIKRLGGTMPWLYDVRFPLWGVSPFTRGHRKLGILMSLVFLVGGASAIYLGLIHETPTHLEEHFVKTEGVVMAFLGAFCIGAGIRGLLRMRRRYPRELDVD